MDDEMLHELRLKGVRVIGVKVRDVGDLWISHIDYFMDREKAPVVMGRGGMTYRALPLRYFKRRSARIRIRR